MSRRTGKTTARPRPMYPALKMPPRVAPAPAAGAVEPDDRLTTLVQRASQHILAVTYWFEPAPQPQPYPVTIRFTGRRVDVEGKLERRDQCLKLFLLDSMVYVDFTRVVGEAWEQRNARFAAEWKPASRV